MRAPATTSRTRQRAEPRTAVDWGLVLGLALMCLGAGLFSLGIYHGFAHGSCSTTGYSQHYGPVPHCASGIGWWMLLLTGGIFVALGGAALSGTASTILAPAMFVAIGAPCIALGLGGAHGQLAYGASSSTGKLEVGTFGACFAISGLVWGAFAGRDLVSRLRFSGLVACVAGVGVAFGVATGVSSAIGSSPGTSLNGLTQSTASNAQSRAAAIQTRHAIAQTRAAAIQTSRAVAQATAQARTATKLAACVTAAGVHSNPIQACERKYMP
jgi:hypothetical protein